MLKVECVVIQALGVEQGGVKITDTHHVFNRLISKIIRSPVNIPALNPPPATQSENACRL